MRYFDHDIGAWKDGKIGALAAEGGLEALGLYWVVVELIYEAGGAVNLSETEPLTKSVARWFGVGSERVSELVEAMVSCGLLTKKRTSRKGALLVTSQRAEENMKRYEARAETARQNGKKGGRKPSGNRVGSDSVTKSEPNGGEKKRKEKLLAFDKQMPNNYDATGAAVGTAPRIVEKTMPTCPECGKGLTATAEGGRFRWICPEHGETEDWIVRVAVDA